MARIGKPHKSPKNPYLHVDVGKGRHKQHARATSPRGVGAWAIWGATKPPKKKR
jgi:hypothetical protein